MPIDVPGHSCDLELGGGFAGEAIDAEAGIVHIFEVSDTIVRIKERMEEKEGIPPIQQRLIFGGKQMHDEKTAKDYNIEGGSVIHMVLALRGGGCV